MEEKDELKALGFEGFVTIMAMKQNVTAPDTNGVYIVLRNNSNAPKFMEIGTGGFFKGNNPNVSIDELMSNWVRDTSIMYIGKTTSLKSRLRQYMSFGMGKPAAHKGGRYIWQLADADSLIVCWRTLQGEDPRQVEKSMIQQFKNTHDGHRPFANLTD